MENKEINRITSLFEAMYEGKPWYGPSAKEVLARIDHKKAFERPIPGAHNIYELVKHMIAWRKFVWKRLVGEENFFLSGEEDWESWHGDKDDLWSNVLAEFDQSQKTMINKLKETSDDILEENVRGKPYNFYTLLHGIIHHDIYHLGQISLLKKNKK